jgi:predicted protein tyrosine phosphatase
MTLRSVSAISLEKARGLRPKADTLLISILGRQEAHTRRRPVLSGWRSVLLMEFEDASEEAVMAKPGSWPLEPTDEDNDQILGRHRGQVPSMRHARQIVEFLKSHHGSGEDLNLIVHCYAGVSRSVMVASKVCDWCGLESTKDLENRLEYANKRLGRLLEVARAECDLDAVLGNPKRQASPGPR